jgi:cytochrome c oxidase cbb3-type subunit I/II
MENPRSISVGSNMPNYPWLLANNLDVSVLPAKIKVQRLLGVPYPALSAQDIFDEVGSQSRTLSRDLRLAGAYVAPEKEIVALIAYLQTLGKSVPVAPKPTAAR